MIEKHIPVNITILDDISFSPPFIIIKNKDFFEEELIIEDISNSKLSIASATSDIDSFEYHTETIDHNKIKVFLRGRMSLDHNTININYKKEANTNSHVINVYRN